MAFNISASHLPRIVIVGGGFAGLQAARGLKGAELQVVLIDKNNYHTFQPLLYQVATAGLEPDSIAYPLRKILKKQKNLTFRMAEVNRVHPESNEIETSIGRISYDYLVLATGTKTNYFGNDSLRQNVFPLKSIQDAFDLRNLILQTMEQALLTTDVSEREALMNFIIVGGGPTGVELAGALGELKHHILPIDYPELDVRRMQVHVIEAANRVLPGMSQEASDGANRFLKQLGISVWLNSPVESYDGEWVKLANGKDLRSDTVIWTAGVLGDPMAGIDGDRITKDDRVRVDRFNRAQGLDNVFVIGDLAYMETESEPEGHAMVAAVAIQQGQRLAKNLRLMIAGKPMRPFVYWDKGSLATIGRNRAVADLRHAKFQGWFAWIVWMFVHLLYLIGFRNKLVVLLNWIWNYFTYDRGIRLILSGFRTQLTEGKVSHTVNDTD